MSDLERRGRNALLGLALGDALGWPAMYHRSRLLPAWTRRIRREMDAEREDSGVLRIPVPFSLNQPRTSFDPGPTDDTEWAAWMMQGLLDHGCTVDPQWITGVWLALAQDTVRGWVSTHTALDNLRRGILPPLSGSDNPHYFDDGAVPRAVPVGIAYAGRPTEAASAAAIDAAVTNSEEGIWVASGVAASVSVACAGGSSTEAVEAAREALPEGSWPRRLLDAATGVHGAPVLEVLASLHELQSVEYSDGCIGPETVATALAIISCSGNRFTEALTAATALPRGADMVPAIVGAIAGALAKDDPIPEMWERALGTLRGISIPALAGKDYLGLVTMFTSACASLDRRKDRL
jgi:ADP-ribosylglycohydrolase